MGKIEYAFRMVHIDNIPHILEQGFVLPESSEASDNYIPIGDLSVILTRWNFSTQYNLKEYIPFYFGTRTPMLYVIQNGFNNVERQEPENIVYCVICLEDIINSSIDCVFTNGHALDRLTTFYPKNELKNVNNYVKYSDVFAIWWNEDDDLKRRKEAELLIKTKLSIKFVKMYIVYNEVAKEKMLEYGVEENKIKVSPKMYY